MSDQDNLPPPPWYKQFWPWFLIMLPGSVVIASMVTIYIAVQNPDTVVADDYYKEGLAINRDLTLANNAVSMGLSATIQFDGEMRSLRVILNKDVIENSLVLTLRHPTLAGRDQKLELRRQSPTVFIAETDPVSPGAWHVALISDQPAWIMRKRIDIKSPGNYSMQ